MSKITTFNFSVKPLSEIKTDILILWTSSSLLAGDENFVAIHQEAGSILRQEVYNIKYEYGTENFKFSHNIITSAGFLKIDKLIHSVLPNYKIIVKDEDRRSLLERTLFNIRETIVCFEEKNYLVLNIAFLPISEKIYGKVDKKTITTYLEYIVDNFKGFHSIDLVFNTEEEKEKYFKVFKKVNNPFLRKIKRICQKKLKI